MSTTNTGRKYAELVERKKIEWGERFSAAALSRKFVRYYESGERIKVECGGVKTGTIGVTTGWRPCFLLMRTARSKGSIWTLGDSDRIIAVKEGRRWRRVDD